MISNIHEGTIYTTTFLASTETSFTSTYEASGTNSGTILYGVPSAGFQTTTTSYGSVSSTITLQQPSATSSGLIEIIQPQGTTTITSYITSTGSTSTSTVQASGSASGTVIDFVPAGEWAQEELNLDGDDHEEQADSGFSL